MRVVPAYRLVKELAAKDTKKPFGTFVDTK
jgi:hypothetical protein